MTDLDAAWWVKLRRASTHRGTLRGLADEFQASEPYTLNPEPGGRAHRCPHYPGGGGYSTASTRTAST